MQAYANRYENLPEGEEDIRKSGLQRVLTMRLSSNEQDPGIPKYVLAQSLGLPALPESHSLPTFCLDYVAWPPGYSGPGARAQYGPDAAAHRAQLPSIPNHYSPPNGWEGPAAAHST